MPSSRLLRAAALGGAVALLITACSPRPTIMTDDGILAAETVLNRAGEGDYSLEVTVRNTWDKENVKLYYDCGRLVWFREFVASDDCASDKPLLLKPGETHHERYTIRADELTDATSAALIYYLESEEQSAAPQRQLRLPLKSDLSAGSARSERYLACLLYVREPPQNLTVVIHDLLRR